MDGTARQQAYDRGSTIFSPDGRLYQVEYAREAVGRGSPSLGITTDAGVVLAATKRVASPLLEAGSIEKISVVDDHVAIASAGHAADARQLVAEARTAAQRHRVRYGEPIDVGALTTGLADHVQESTQTGGSRPYGAALLVAGIDDSGPGLYEVDPSGTPYGWRAVAIGRGSDDIRHALEQRFDESVDTDDETEPQTRGTDTGTDSDRASSRATVATIDDGIDLALDVLDDSAERSIGADAIDVCTLETGTRRLERLSRESLEERLSRRR